MAKFPPAERARIRAALEAHTRDSKDLTISAYARAAGISRDATRTILGQMGLPAKKDPTLNDPVIPPPTPSEKVPATSPTPPLDTPSPTPTTPVGAPPALS